MKYIRENNKEKQKKRKSRKDKEITKKKQVKIAKSQNDD